MMPRTQLLMALGWLFRQLGQLLWWCLKALTGRGTGWPP